MTFGNRLARLSTSHNGFCHLWGQRLSSSFLRCPVTFCDDQQRGHSTKRLLWNAKQKFAGKWFMKAPNTFLGCMSCQLTYMLPASLPRRNTTFSDSDMPLWVKNLLISLSLPGFPIRQSSAAHCLLQLCDFAEEKCEMSKNVCFGLLFIAVCQCVGFRASPTSQFVTSKKWLKFVFFQAKN